MSGPFNITHTDAPIGLLLELEIEEMGDLAVEVTRIVGTKAPLAELLNAVRHADVILNSLTVIDGRVIDAAIRCRGIIRYGVGFDNIEVAAATERGIVVANVRDYCTDEVANHTIMFLLALARKLCPLDANMRGGGWNKGAALPQAVYGETLGIVGLGRIGRAVARRAEALNLRILAYDPYVDGVTMGDHHVEKVDLDTLLRESDYVSLHADLNDETRHLIGRRELALMKPSAYLINTARGPEVDTQALIGALNEGQIAGAATDVYDEEPLPAGSPLRSIENLLMTPHSAYFSSQSLVKLRKEVGRAAAAILRGRWPKFVVNPEVAKKVSLQPYDGP
jgi:D-3-phosphoglycerate dehydrogenase / 2-oxoglutarate reductase